MVAVSRNDDQKKNEFNLSARFFQFSGILVVLQFALGGLVSNNVISPVYHIVLGLGLLAAAIATAVVVMTAKPHSKSIILLSGLLVLLVGVQAPIGFTILDGAGTLFQVTHVTIAMAVLIIALTGYFVARRLGKTITIIPRA